MNNAVIREMRDFEYSVCADVIRRGFSTVADEFKLTPDNCPTNGAFITKEHLSSEHGKSNYMFVLCLEDKIIGFVELESRGDCVFEMEKLTVLPQYRHLGYGKALIDFAAEKARASGGRKITIGIIEDNTRLKDWYAGYGFVHTGTKKFSHLPFTVGFMRLDL